jgi:hypothetical protein
MLLRRRLSGVELLAFIAVPPGTDYRSSGAATSELKVLLRKNRGGRSNQRTVRLTRRKSFVLLALLAFYLNLVKVAAASEHIVQEV